MARKGRARAPEGESYTRFDWVQRHPYARTCFNRDELRLYRTTVVDGVDVDTKLVGFVTWHGERRVGGRGRLLGDIWGGCIYDLNAPGMDESNWCETDTKSQAKRWCERKVKAEHVTTTVE